MAQCFALPEELRRKRHKLTLEPGRKTYQKHARHRKHLEERMFSGGSTEFQQCDFWWFWVLLPFHFWCFWAFFHDFGVLQPLHIWRFWAIFDDFGVLLPLHFCVFERFLMIWGYYYLCILSVFEWFLWFWGGRSVVSSLKWALLTERLELGSWDSATLANGKSLEWNFN